MLRRFAILRWRPALQAHAWIVALTNRVTSERKTGMATLKRADSKKLNETRPRSCIACTENEHSVQLIRPCRSCNSDYCIDCVLDMFLAATTDNGRMPPRCCVLIQIHTILGHLTHDQAKQYRAKFEEWITPIKTYCPSPTCSAFIPEKRLPTTLPNPTTPPSLKSVLTEVLLKVSSSGSARFFRGELDITELPGFTNVVKNHIDLSMIQGNLDRYRSTNDVTVDMRLLVSNAKEYNGEGHPVTAAANELFSKYLLEISDATDRLITATSTPTGPQLFACPKCHVAICSDCKQVEHTGNACDISAADHETAMLETFEYKRCPRCKAGVKKMFGCSHMACICGAHWCYWCQKSTNECDGSCDEREADDEEEDDYDGEEDDHANEASEVEMMESRLQPRSNAGNVENAAPTSPRPYHRIVNLDAGGDRRWAETDYDFGEEPEEEPYSQIWSCHHTFKAYEAPLDDGFNRGDLDRMECNRCFEQVRAQKAALPPETSSKKRQKNASRPKDIVSTNPRPDATDGANGQAALECSRCRLVVCVKCRDKYNAPEGS